MSKQSPRYLTLRHAQKLALNAGEQQPEDDPEKLGPGEERLYSYYAPNLKGGNYQIKVDQKINSPAQAATGNQVAIAADNLSTPTTYQDFTVVTPHFTLPKNSVHSTYPPQGYACDSNVAPHIVLNDVHLPWENNATAKTLPDPDRSMVPWLALLTFTQDELQIQSAELDQIFGAGTALRNAAKPDATFAFNMKVTDVNNLAKSSNPATINSSVPVPTDSSQMANIIFVPSALYPCFFSAYDANGARQGTPNDVSRYQYLSHVRDINTEGMANSGIEDVGIFSVVVSHRSGPLNITQPSPTVVHLVSIENVETMSYNASLSRVAMVSLYSWTYTCNPPGSFNVFDAFEHLAGPGLGLLRAPASFIPAPDGTTTTTQLINLLNDGYTLTRYRTQAGDETAAIVRGALTPVSVPFPLTNTWTTQSNSGSDLQIYNSDLGLMDITYSAAWQLGKSMALADVTFTAALSRIRRSIHTQATELTKVALLKKQGAYKSREDVVSSLPDSIEKLASIHQGGGYYNGPDSDTTNRWQKAVTRTQVKIPKDSDEYKKSYLKHVNKVAADLAGTTDGPGFYNEVNTPRSTDWMTLLAWVLDRMVLSNIPPQYLILDSKYLPLESLNFFNIDQNWTYALIDGALSLANHLNDDDDTIRTSIWTTIKSYLNTVDPTLKYKPQVPLYGFLLRSDVVSRFPDLRVSATVAQTDVGPALVRHVNLDSGLMLGLLESLPGSSGLTNLVFTQPPHQQSFIIADGLSDTSFETEFKRIYTVTTSDPDSGKSLGTVTWTNPATAGQSPVFIWKDGDVDARVMLFPAWSDYLLQYLNDNMNKTGTYFSDTVATSALVGLQMNYPIYILPINPSTTTQLSTPQKSQHTSVPSDQPTEASPAEQLPGVDTPTSSGSTSAGILKGTGQTGKTSSKPSAALPRSVGTASATSPHFTRLLVPKLRSNPLAFIDEGGPSNRPVYKVGVVQLNSDPNYIPIITGTGYYLDLVFSVQLKHIPPGVWNLSEIQVEIPMGQPDPKNPSLPKYLTSGYDGPGPTMLRNLRLNVAVTPDETTKQLVFSLIPRSTSGAITLDQATDASFLLSTVNVLNYPQYTDPILVQGTIYHTYVDSQKNKTTFHDLIELYLKSTQPQ
ncbi:hypothetical protein TWF730_002361 [Orbilia blumenaviensis]|uniref:Uncharacterized protein n=1 Tax=Orbilia blumenaviensis TaxID=1796055 RepID=A0AAV9UBC9_9PEZI